MWLKAKSLTPQNGSLEYLKREEMWNPPDWHRNLELARHNPSHSSCLCCSCVPRRSKPRCVSPDSISATRCTMLATWVANPNLQTCSPSKKGNEKVAELVSAKNMAKTRSNPHWGVYWLRRWTSKQAWVGIQLNHSTGYRLGVLESQSSDFLKV